MRHCMNVYMDNHQLDMLWQISLDVARCSSFDRSPSTIYANIRLWPRAIAGCERWAGWLRSKRCSHSPREPRWRRLCQNPWPACGSASGGLNGGRVPNTLIFVCNREKYLTNIFICRAVSVQSEWELTAMAYLKLCYGIFAGWGRWRSGSSGRRRVTTRWLVSAPLRLRVCGGKWKGHWRAGVYPRKIRQQTSWLCSLQVITNWSLTLCAREGGLEAIKGRIYLRYVCVMNGIVFDWKGLLEPVLSSLPVKTPCQHATGIQ